MNLFDICWAPCRKSRWQLHKVCTDDQRNCGHFVSRHVKKVGAPLVDLWEWSFRMIQDDIVTGFIALASTLLHSNLTRALKSLELHMKLNMPQSNWLEFTYDPQRFDKTLEKTRNFKEFCQACRGRNRMCVCVCLSVCLRSGLTLGRLIFCLFSKRLLLQIVEMLFDCDSCGISKYLSTAQAGAKCVSAFWPRAALEHSSCKFQYKIALVRSPSAFRMRRRAPNVRLGLLPLDFCMALFTCPGAFWLHRLSQNVRLGLGIGPSPPHQQSSVSSSCSFSTSIALKRALAQLWRRSCAQSSNQIFTQGTCRI